MNGKTNIKRTLFGKNSLLTILAISITLAFFSSDWCARGGKLHTEHWTQAGIFLLFFLHGLGLSTEKLRNGLLNIRLHLFTQTWISLLIPLLTLAYLTHAGNNLPLELSLGLFFLAALPTTVSSAVTHIAEGQGNLAGGVFNTVISNLSAVLLVPAWMLWFQTQTVDKAPPLLPVLQQLLLMLLLPFALGHILHLIMREKLAPLQKSSRTLNLILIGFILYVAFATGFRDGVWSKITQQTGLQGLLLTTTALLLISALVWLTARLTFPSPPDRLAAFFCASQKSLIIGVPFASIIFGQGLTIENETISTSIILLPLLIYHPLQLILGALALNFRHLLFGQAPKPNQP